MATMFRANMEKALETVSEYEKKVCEVNIVCAAVNVTFGDALHYVFQAE